MRKRRIHSLPPSIRWNRFLRSQAAGSWNLATGFDGSLRLLEQFRMPRFFVLIVAMSLAAASDSSVLSADSSQHDVVIYGGTSGGVVAAVQARRMGKSVALLEPGRHLGGLTSGGLGATDIGNKKAIGGLSLDFYRRVKKYYDNPAAWKQERSEQYRSPRQSGSEETMWTFEPHVAERLLDQLVTEARVDLFRQERLDRVRGVTKENGRIVRIRMESGRTFEGRVFIDATYEGDLMAAAGVSYTIGREANSQYDETLNGVQTRNAIHHQFVPGVDPYVKRGDSSSGLLPGVHGDPPGEEGSADKRVQAYCFRMCVTDSPENRLPFEKPAGYDERRYELLFRNFEAAEKRIPWSPTMMPNRKTDTNNNFGFSTDNIGMNDGWSDGDDATRDRIFQEHLLYQRGLMWTLANHVRVPEAIRQEVSRWGNCRDEFSEFGGWSHQLYVREARRLVGAQVMTQHHCQGREKVTDSVGLAAYTMDSHNVQRYIDAKGQVRNEGDVQVGGFPPYGISYRALLPQEKECTNLLVPVCLSATHIAYGSIRMEPVFMVLGQSAATAACQAIDSNVSVQRVDYAKLRERLLADQQVLDWTAPARPAVSSLDPKQLPGIVLDDESLERSGDWLPSSSVGGFVGACYWHDGNTGEKSARFVTRLKMSGEYEVRLSYTPNPNRATNVKVSIRHADGESPVIVNQRLVPPIDKAFVTLGKFHLVAEKEVVITISNAGADGHVIVDAVQLLPVKRK